MKQPKRETVLKQLQIIPGVGPSIAGDLWDLGIRSVPELKRHSPEQLYEALCRKTGTRQDRCVLYVFRCAVYFASTPEPEPELLKWWNWTDRNPAAGSRIR